METIDTFRLIYESFIESNQTVSNFCRQHDIPQSRFFYWQRKLRKASAKSSGEFVLVSINNHSGKVVLVGNGSQTVHSNVQERPTCEIILPNGVTVRLSGEVPAATLGQLIMLGR